MLVPALALAGSVYAYRESGEEYVLTGLVRELGNDELTHHAFNLETELMVGLGMRESWEEQVPLPSS